MEIIIGARPPSPCSRRDGGGSSSRTDNTHRSKSGAGIGLRFLRIYFFDYFFDFHIPVLWWVGCKRFFQLEMWNIFPQPRFWLAESESGGRGRQPMIARARGRNCRWDGRSHTAINNQNKLPGQRNNYCPAAFAGNDGKYLLIRHRSNLALLQLIKRRSWLW